MGFAFLRPGIDGIWGIETVGIETVGMETLGRLDGNQPDTLPVTFENIPPAAFVGLRKAIQSFVIRFYDANTQIELFSTSSLLPLFLGLLIYWWKKCTHSCFFRLRFFLDNNFGDLALPSSPPIAIVENLNDRKGRKKGFSRFSLRIQFNMVLLSSTFSGDKTILTFDSQHCCFPLVAVPPMLSVV